MNCILFLDFDGVTHPDPCAKTEYFRQVPLIEEVLRQYPDLNMVISSSWRYDHTLKQLRSFFSADIGQRVIDVTPSVRRTDTEGWIPQDQLQYHREWECMKWIRQKGILQTPWIAIDDAAEWFTPKCSHLLVTRSEFGFQDEHVPVLHRMLNELHAVRV